MIPGYTNQTVVFCTGAPAANVTCLGAIPGCGQLCEFGSADADQCPDRQQCMSPEMLDASDGNAHCSCYAIFGHMQEDCSGVSDKSIFVGVTIGVVAILSASVCCVYFHTIFTYLKNVLGAGEQLKLNSAVSTMLLGMTTALMGVPNMAGYSLSAFQIGDPTMTFHRHWSPKITSLLVMCSIPTMLNVSTMWVDVALRSMAGSKSSRAATKKKYQYAVWGFYSVFSLMVLVCMVTGRVLVVMFLMVIITLIIMVSYRVGAIKLMKLLNKEDLSSQMIIQTASRISYAMLLTLVSSMVQVVLGRQTPQTEISYVQVVFLLGVFTGMLAANFQVLLYIRFGLRKKLGLTYLDVKGIRRYSSHTTAATEAATAEGSERSAGTFESTPVEEMSPTKNSQVAPAP